MKEMTIHLDHIGIATDSLEEGSTFWRLLGLFESDEDELNEEQGVSIRFFSTSPEEGFTPRLELLEPTSEDTPIGKFLDRKGAGIQQICFRVSDLASMLKHLKTNGVKLIDEEPRKGAGNTLIAFVHPHSTGGVLVELSQHL
jgi:methylmalonyl-CoA/ethylmalonyl-CoA epimerase